LAFLGILIIIIALLAYANIMFIPPFALAFASFAVAAAVALRWPFAKLHQSTVGYPNTWKRNDLVEKDKTRPAERKSTKKVSPCVSSS
jgi:hypothetical protein